MNDEHSCMYNLHILHILLLHLKIPFIGLILIGFLNRAFERRRSKFGGCLCANTILLFLKLFLVFSSSQFSIQILACATMSLFE